jgi:8-oxo-dGTP diphosphatase
VKGYNPQDYPPIAVTVDLVVLTIRADQLTTLLIRRGQPPYRGRWALPGGFIHPDEDLAAAARRELAEETGVDAPAVHLEQLRSYGAPRRDPRMRVITVAHLVLAPDLPVPTAGSDAAAAGWHPVDGLDPRRLAFDHRQILADGVERARLALERSPVATAFCPAEFTVAELRRIYEIVWGVELDPRNFHRKVTGTAGFLSPAGRTTTRDGGRPAQLFRRGDTTSLHPPMLRPGPRGTATGSVG